ncbi:hypothetical protein [Burkholderia glumae]
MKKTAALAVFACFVLSACGGDDGGSSPTASSSTPSGSTSTSGSTGSTGNGSGSGSTNSGSTLTSRFEALAPAADAASFLTLVNAEGAKGFRYLGDQFYSSDNAIRSVFVNDGSASTYTYELLAPPSTQSDRLTQLNAQGARGFRFDGGLNYGTLYRNDGSSATYSYQFLPGTTSASAFLTQANAQGQSGYWYVGPFAFGGATQNMYMKNAASNATYAYEAPAAANTASDFITQANAEGARGYRAKGEAMIGSDDVEIYFKDQTQSPTFTFQSATTQTTSAAFLTQANTLGAQGNAYFGDLGFSAGTPTTASVYLSAKNCIGFICTTLNPLLQN